MALPKMVKKQAERPVSEAGLSVQRLKNHLSGIVFAGKGNGPLVIRKVHGFAVNDQFCLRPGNTALRGEQGQGSGSVFVQGQDSFLSLLAQMFDQRFGILS